MFLSTNRFIGYILAALFVILLVVNTIRGLLDNDYDDEYVTIQYSCKTALANPSQYPVMVNDECRKLQQDKK